MNLPRAHHLRLISALVLTALVWMAFTALPRLSHAEGAPPSDASGFWYTIQRGDSWTVVAQRTGISVAELKKANPKAIHPSDWLWFGERLFVPGSTGLQGYWYQVKPDDTWNTVAKATGVSAGQLWAANPGLQNTKRWLYIGQRMWIPAPPPSGAAVTVTPVPTAATPAPGVKAGCPATLAEYPAAITAYLKKPGHTSASLKTWLTSCGAITNTAGSFTSASIVSSNKTDLIIVLSDPTTDVVSGKGMLLIYHAPPKNGYVLVRQAEGEGLIKLLKVDDINADGKLDVIWTDTTCGAHTCFSILFVDSWDGSAYLDNIAGEPAMAQPDYTFKDVATEGSGAEILVHGGIIGSVGAGPQRAWTETYISAQGGPYELFKQAYDASNCLYHHVLDANRVFDTWTAEGFDPAVAAYQAIVADTTLVACGALTDEVQTLQDFARFRTVVALVGGGRAAEVPDVLAQITHAGLRGAAETFFSAYKSSGSVIGACQTTTTYATSNPNSWQFLADWGYANPTFTADDLCPLK